ncbi:MAG: ATP-binding protein [Desulfococcaceae bacterium]|jgi:hypothetical protein|nr:ATP-binding protein [Desulfococcaceae bacterium]
MINKFFNIAGPCQPDIHYMVNPLPRLSGVTELIDRREYFILHAPRQTGKTTYLYALMHQLNQKGKYTALQVNIQEAASGTSPEKAMKIAAGAIYFQAEKYLPPDERPENTAEIGQEEFEKGHSLRGYLKRWCQNNPKPVVLFIDEADSLMDDLFLTLLRQLRSGFEGRPQSFPQSVALVGLRDIRDYKIRIRPEKESMGTGSPFNVKSKSFFMGGFTFEETCGLLDEHKKESGQAFSTEIQKEIFRLSAGQPWLTNALANQIVFEILKNDCTKEITHDHVIQAKELLIQRRDTHLDSLIDKLNEAKIKPLAEAIISGNAPEFDSLNDSVAYARDLGLIAPDPPVRFANPIYQEIIPRVLSFGFQEMLPQDIVQPQWYIKENRLDMDALLTAFQKFYRRHSESWLKKYSFRETGRQLLLMAFLQRIINSGGRIEREMAAGNGRCDLWIEYGGEEHILELKLYHDQFTREDGLEQIARYMDQMGVPVGNLIIFETRSGISWEDRVCREEIASDGKQIILWGM